MLTFFESMNFLLFFLVVVWFVLCSWVIVLEFFCGVEVVVGFGCGLGLVVVVVVFVVGVGLGVRVVW